jgi:hypothetical protein
MNLPATWRRPLLVTHIAASVGALGVDLVLLTLGISGARGADAATVYPAAHTIAEWVLIPLAVIALATGIVQGAQSQWGLLQSRWVTAKLVITVALFVVVVAVLVPGLGRAADAAAGSAPHALSSTERLPYALAPIGASLLLLLNVGLGVYKPGSRAASHPPIARAVRG